MGCRALSNGMENLKQWEGGILAIGGRVLSNGREGS